MGSQSTQRLADRICEAGLYVKPHPGFGVRDSFLPAGTYCDPTILNADVIREELGLEPGQNAPLVEFVLDRAPKIFVAIACLERPRAQACQIMQDFMDHEFDDGRLPIKLDYCNSSPAFSGGWTRNMKLLFYKGQWEHLAPLFSGTNFYFRIEPEQPLPFLEPENGIQRAPEGASSIVHKVIIHEDHLVDFPSDLKSRNNRRQHVAVKEIRVADCDNAEFQLQFDNEAMALQAIRDLNHRNIIQWIAAFTRGTGHYLIFPWADGGSLRDFWKEVQPLTMDIDGIRNLVSEMLHQFRGLTDAFVKMHLEKKYRHGDVKPENILRFSDGKTTTGILKIADFGLAKQHNGSTVLRGPTATRHTTFQYESPEAEEAMHGVSALSRLSDIWSLGCVLLEHIVWLLYGSDEAKRFGENLNGSIQNVGPAPFYIRRAAGVAIINPQVNRWIAHMKQDPVGGNGTAIGALLSIIQNNMLTAGPLRSHWDSEKTVDPVAGPVTPQPGTRATAKELLCLIDKIIADTNKSESGKQYLFKDFGTTQGQPGRKARGLPDDTNIPLPIRSMPPQQDLLSPLAAAVRPLPKLTGAKSSSPPPVKIEMTFNLAPQKDMNPNWNFAIDSEIPDRIGADGMFPTSLPSATTLCAACKNLKFGDPGFNFTYLTNDLKSRAPICGLCSMLWSICVMHNKSQQREVKFEKYQSTLKMGDDTTPVLSMISSPELKTVTQLQLGFPELPESGSDMHFNVIRHWLASCDTTHNCAPGSDPRDVITLPTRLIDVGSVGSPTVRLVETKEVDIPIKDRVSPYIALSHPWGPPPHFCTFPNDPGRPLARNTLAQHKVGIDVSVLPATFRDGVIATRALGKKYLWVDSLCILQGPKGDFQDEAVKMETVFSSAYCVLAASWAAKQEDGFLKTMPGQEELRAKRDRKVITIKADDNTAPLYICEMIDNFDQHVLNGGLNQRAWVLQERALARRTVYFTERQTYWECGEGVRCETMTKMTNKLASFLGDPLFPSLALQGNRGEQIRWYQSLYRQYSRLGISHNEDRPIAIRSLETRLVAAFKAANPNFSGRYGILNDGPTGGLLHRSLLWRRGSQKGDPSRLENIVFPPGHDGAPSWSWMHYRSGIDFIPVEGNTLEWRDLKFANPRTLVAPAWDFRCDIRKTEDGSAPSELVFDCPGGTAGHVFKCVVVGSEKAEPARGDEGARLHFVLIVEPASVTERGAGVVRNLRPCRRIGAGSLPGRCIEGLGTGGKEVAIV